MPPRPLDIEIVSHDYDVVKFLSPMCSLYNERTLLELDSIRFGLWSAGSHIDDLIPETPDAEREVFISGTHPKCWDIIFGEEK